MLEMIGTFLLHVLGIASGLSLIVLLAAAIACAIPDEERVFTQQLTASHIDDDGTRVLVLHMDSVDWRDIQRAIATRQLRRNWPKYEADEGMSNVAGMAIAEIAREWMSEKAKA